MFSSQALLIFCFHHAMRTPPSKATRSKGSSLDVDVVARRLTLHVSSQFEDKAWQNPGRHAVLDAYHSFFVENARDENAQRLNAEVLRSAIAKAFPDVSNHAALSATSLSAAYSQASAYARKEAPSRVSEGIRKLVDEMRRTRANERGPVSTPMSLASRESLASSTTPPSATRAEILKVYGVFG